MNASLGIDSFDPVMLKLNKDLKEAAKRLTSNEARYLVDSYYVIQNYRIATANQRRSLAMAEEPGEMINWFLGQHMSLEKNIKRVLDIYTDNDPVGRWCKGIAGIGPVLAAGLIAHIDITEAPTAGHIWSYAGLTPESIWLGREKAQKLVSDIVGNSKTITANHIAALATAAHRKPDRLSALAIDDKGKITKKSLSAALAKRPWNARFKVLTWKIGESFVKVSNNPKAYYGAIYRQRKELEVANNEAGMYAEQAAQALASKKYDKETDAYKAYVTGKLPPAHLQARAKRYAVKLFLAHLQEEMYVQKYGQQPPLPYPIAMLGHAHKIERPGA